MYLSSKGSTKQDEETSCHTQAIVILKALKKILTNKHYVFAAVYRIGCKAPKQTLASSKTAFIISEHYLHEFTQKLDLAF